MPSSSSSSSVPLSSPPSLLATNIPPPPQFAAKQNSTLSPTSFSSASSPTSNASAAAMQAEIAMLQQQLALQQQVNNSNNNRARAGSTLSDESQRSTVSSSVSSNDVPSKDQRVTKQKTPPVAVIPKKKEEKRRQLTPQELFNAGVTFRSLSIQHCTDQLEKLISSEFADEVAGAAVGQALVTHAVETSPSSVKTVAKAAGLLKDTPCFPGLHRGFVLGLGTFADKRDSMRQDRYRSWLALITLNSDLFQYVGDNEQGDIVSQVFDTFRFLLRAPMLENVKIEELECLISTLFTIGYELECECPERLAQLKDLIRDAFIEVSEPWARKMILLMLELSASNWKLPIETNEYYFHQIHEN